MDFQTEKIKLTNIKFDEMHEDEEVKYINFTANDTFYLYLKIGKEEAKEWKPWYVHHDVSENGIYCPFCKKMVSSGICSFFEDDSDELYSLYQELLNTDSIRIRSIYKGLRNGMTGLITNLEKEGV